jgi:hypothetical protein
MWQTIARSTVATIIIFAAIDLKFPLISSARAADSTTQPATTSSANTSAGEKLASLQEQLTKMKGNYAQAQVKAFATNPLLAEAWRRIAANEKADRNDSIDAKWHMALRELDQQEAKGTHAWENYRSIAPIYFSLGLATMTREPTDQNFLHEYFLSHQDLVTNTAADLAKRFPDLANLKADNSSVVWDAYLSRSGALADSLEKEADKLSRQSGIPDNVSQLQKMGCALDARHRVYWSYEMSHQPPEMIAMRREMRTMQSEIDSLKAMEATQPSTD